MTEPKITTRQLNDVIAETMATNPEFAAGVAAARERLRPTPTNEQKREFYLRQWREHQPGPFGGCPICGGTERCDPRREATDVLDEMDVDLAQPPPSPVSEALKLMYIEEYLAHRDCDPPCVDVKQAVEHLIASGVDPATVTS